MKYIFLALMLLIPQAAINANNFALNRQQAHAIANVTFLLGVIGSAAGLSFAHEKYLQENSYKELTYWQAIKAFKWHYAALGLLTSAVAGSLVYADCVIDNAVDSYYKS